MSDSDTKASGDEPAEDVLDGPYVWKRGTIEFDRVMFLTDAVFAIAMTLLVLDLHVPDVPADQLQDTVLGNVQPFFAFGLTFAVIALNWMGHHRFSSTLARVDHRFVELNFLYLAGICLMPYVSSLISRNAQSAFAVATYTGFIAFLALVGGLATVLAVECGFTTEPGYTRWARYDLLDSGLRCAVFATAAVIAVLAPDPGTALLWLLVYIPVSMVLGRFDPVRPLTSRRRRR